MSNVFALTIRGTNFIPIFVGLVIFMAISIVIIGYIGDTSTAASDSLNETTEVGITVMNTQFDSLYAEETSIHVYSEVDPTFSAELSYEVLEEINNPADGYTESGYLTGSWTYQTYQPNTL